MALHFENKQQHFSLRAVVCTHKISLTAIRVWSCPDSAVYFCFRFYDSLQA